MANYLISVEKKRNRSIAKKLQLLAIKWIVLITRDKVQMLEILFTALRQIPIHAI